MRTSVKYLDSSYLKIFPMEVQTSPEIQTEAIQRPTQVVEQLPAYTRQLIRNKRYYDNNKEQVLAKQKIYKDSKPLYDKARVRLLHFLNNDSNYYTRMKDSTKEKYNFKMVNGRWT